MNRIDFMLSLVENEKRFITSKSDFVRSKKKNKTLTTNESLTCIGITTSFHRDDN